MCGRYHITRPLEVVAEVFDATIPEEIREAAATMLPRYNISPTQMVPIIRIEVEGPNRGQRIVDFAHWGLIPGWAKDTSMAPRMINARSETVAEKPSFRAAFRHRRCLIPTSGFYEWKTVNPGTSKSYKQPHRIYFEDERLMVMAGLFEVWQAPDSSALGSCSMLTTEASKSMGGLHARMPVVLDSEDEWEFDMASEDSDEDCGGGSSQPQEKVVRTVQLPEAITVSELANRMSERVADVVKSLMQSGIM